MIATKFGLVPGDGYGGYVISGRPDYVRRACDASLKRLGTDHIDRQPRWRTRDAMAWLPSRQFLPSQTGSSHLPVAYRVARSSASPGQAA